jgi:hypothetical protein
LKNEVIKKEKFLDQISGGELATPTDLMSMAVIPNLITLAPRETDIDNKNWLVWDSLVLYRKCMGFLNRKIKLGLLKKNCKTSVDEII